jgi:aryl-alcohol dehydrogenase-like predicted oxidoreductase
MDAACIATAFEAGINYFFFYDFTNEKFLAGLRSLLATKREQVLVATGSQERDLNWVRHDFDSVRQQLNIDVVDAFFVEYIYPSEDMQQVEAVLSQLQLWQQKGFVRYVGITTHNRPIALDLIERGKCKLLMHRYNMAHRKAEENVLPSAQIAGIPEMGEYWVSIPGRA